MPFAFTCPHCGLQTIVADQYSGQSGPCAGCGATVTMPAPGGAPFAVPATHPPRTQQSGAGVVIVIVSAIVGLLLCGGFLAALLVPAVQSTRGMARRNSCASQLRQIAGALKQYQAVYGTLPPAYLADENGRPIHSWRALILPFLDANLAANYRFDEPWDGPNNSRLAATPPPVFHCPADDSAAAGETNFVVVASPQGAFDKTKATPLGAITDGLANTVLVVEVTGTKINWLEPRDLDASTMSFLLDADAGGEISSRHSAGAHVLTADGGVHFLPADTTPEEIQGMISISGGEAVFVP